MAKLNKNNYQVTIGYKAVLQASVKASSEEEAKRIALTEFEKVRNFGKIEISDDSFRVDGILDMDRTFNMLYTD